jgi:serine/threonine-protein kinase
MLEPGGQSPVSTQSAISQLALMLQLRTFGGLSLSRGEENLTGAITQRRRLAILALLAVAGDAGMSRDKLLAYLWPESTAERARHVLNQLLYAQRRQAGSDSLFLGQKTLRLNPDLIQTDVGMFEQAMERRELEQAVALYRGPYLDGFFLKDAAEFERWVEAQRQRYARRCLTAFIALARGSSTAGDKRTAVEWWRRAAEQDPLDGEAVLGLVEALLAIGDRAGMLREARRHEALLRSELDVSPDPRITELLRGSGAAPPA